MEIIGYAGALLMGLSLGLIGSGGSILTVPILVYLFAVDTLLATTYSLFIVGLTSLVGATVRAGSGHIHWPTTLTFGIPSVISVFLTRSYLLPLIPDPIFHLSGFTLTRSAFLLLLFAILMLFSSFSMIQDHSTNSNDDSPTSQGMNNFFAIFTKGIFVGGVTGILGAGGGFLIIPALVLMAKLTMKQAVGTSLVIIATNSLTGFWRDYELHELINWQFLLHFSTIAIIGILIGSTLSRQIGGDKLKPIFGYFVLIMGFYIIVKELFLS
jgi:uncharacterized membrane protein YfcA